jgi:hypothetical protein
MKRHLSRKQFLSLGVYGGLGFIAAHCTLESTHPEPEDGGSGGSTGSATSATTGSTATTSTTGPTTASATTSGSGGSTGSTTSSTTSGTGGKGGAGGSAGSGGKGGTGGSGGSGGSKDAGAGGGGQDAGGMCTGMLTANISMNHVGMEHILVIPAADVLAGVAKTYVTTGVTQNHMHYVALTAADFTTLQGGGVVTKHSCNGGDHQYTIKCGTPPTAGTQTCTTTDNCGMNMTGTPASGGPC